MKSFSRFLLLTVSSLSVMACSTIQQHEMAVKVDPEVQKTFLAEKPVETHRLYSRVLSEGERNLVLNHMRSGLAALQVGSDDVAAASFDQALDKIETIYADNPKAAEARSLFTKENVKDFKGEPYERAMAYYYRGLIHLKHAEYEEARNAFKAGILQDTMAADQNYTADFASLAFLDGWSSRCMGKASAAQEGFKEARKLRTGLMAPALQDNLLLIVETGTSPVKVNAGEHGEMMEQKQGKAGWLSAKFDVGGKPVEAHLAEDVYWQASTRGGRQIQAVLDGKAQFKNVSDTVGDVAAVSAAGMLAISQFDNSNNPGAVYASLALGLFSLAAKGVAAVTRPEADLRYWDNLPDTILLATMPLPEDRASVSLVDRQTGAKLAVPVSRNGTCSIGWIRTESALKIPDSAMNAVAGEAK